jgi:hypothetical protein
MSTLTLTLADFRAQVPLSDKVEDSQVRPFIQFAYMLDLLPLLSYDVLDAVDALTVPKLDAYTAAGAYTAGQMVVRRERVYRALVDTTGLTIPAGSASTPEWAYEPLVTLWTQYLKSWWVQAAYVRFLPQHGLNVTKAGITVPVDRQNGTYDRPTAAQKSELTAGVDSTAEALRSRLTRFLHTESQDNKANGSTGYSYFPDAACAAPARLHGTRLRGINTKRSQRGLN